MLHLACVSGTLSPNFPCTKGDDSLTPRGNPLGIFDVYRQDMELQPGYKTLWNSRNGWFKLTHMCRSWRHLVHLSPSCLDVHLLFTPSRSSRVTMLRCLPPFPILDSHCPASWMEKEEILAAAAIRHHSHVCVIVLGSDEQQQARIIYSHQKLSWNNGLWLDSTWVAWGLSSCVTIGPPFSFISLSLLYYSWLVMWSHHVITYVTYCFVTSIVCDPLSR